MVQASGVPSEPQADPVWMTIAAWLASLTSPATRRTYQTAVQSFIGFHEVRSLEALRTVGPAQIVAWCEHLAATGASAVTVQNRLAAMASLFRYLQSSSAAGPLANPVAQVARPRLTASASRGGRLAPEQVRRLLYAPGSATLMGLRDRAILYTLFYTGCRVSAITQLRVGDWRQEGGGWVLDVPTLDQQRQPLAAHPELQRALHPYLAQSGHWAELHAPLFLALRDGAARKPLTPRQIAKLFHHYAALAHLPANVTPHSARATFISAVLERRCPLEAVQAVVGHRRRATTERYNPRRPHYRDWGNFGDSYEPSLSVPNSDPAPGS